MARQTCISVLQLLLLVSGLAATGCGSPAASPRADPINYHLLCLADTGSQTVTCDPRERLAQFNAFAKEAIHRPHSTFTVWQIGPDRPAARPFFSACVPDRWGSHVMKAKTDFIQKAREGAAGSRSGLSEPAGCHPPGTTSPGSTKLVILDASPLKPDVWEAVSSASGQVQVHSSIVCDRSESTQLASCTPSLLLRFFDRWIAEGLLVPGASLSVEMVGPLKDALRPIFEVSVPSLPDGERISFVLAARVELARLFNGSREQYASTIAEAISTAVRRLREHRGIYGLTILSDMQQITAGPGGLNFEKSLPTPQAFQAWLKQKGLAADLRNIPVVVCGIPTGHFGQNSASYAARLQELWQRAFQAMGVPNLKWFSNCETAFAA